MSQTHRVAGFIVVCLVSQVALNYPQEFAGSTVCLPQQAVCYRSPSECSIYLPQNITARYRSLSKRPLIALILARGGSKGIRLKNLRFIGGVSLLARSLKVIHKSDVFEDVWVSTDHMDIAEEAFKYGAKVHIRPESVSEDTTTSIAAVQEFLYHHRNIQNIALIQCTSVFLKVAYLQEAFEKFKTADCVFSVVRSWKLRWNVMVDERSESLVALNFSPDRRPRRQDWNGELLETGMFYISTRKLLKSGRFQNDRFVEIMAKDALEIDTHFDLKLAQFILNEDHQ